MNKEEQIQILKDVWQKLCDLEEQYEDCSELKDKVDNWLTELTESDGI